MISFLPVKQKLFRFAEIIHLRFFGHEMGTEMKDFLGHLSWSFFGGMIASVLMLALNVVIGRFFGPEEYGKYNIVLILSQLLLIFVYVGTDVSSVRFLSGEKDQAIKKTVLSSSLYFVLLMIFLFWITYYFIRSEIEYYFHVESQYVALALILGTALALKGIVDGYLRSYSLFRFQAVLRMMETVIVILFLCAVLNIIGIKEYRYYIYALSAGATVFSIVTLIQLRKYLGAFQWASLKSLLSYGSVILLGTILGITFNSLDKIIVAKYLGVVQLGIYSAYFMTATNLIAQMTQVFNNVFFPAISQATDTAYVGKIDALIRWLAIPGGIILSLLLYGIVLIFGEAYQPNIILSIGFGFLAVLQVIFTINASVITALSKRLLKRYYYWLYGISCLHVVIYGVLISLKFVTITSLLFLFFLNFTTMIFIQKRLISTFIQTKVG